MQHEYLDLVTHAVASLGPLALGANYENAPPYVISELPSSYIPGKESCFFVVDARNPPLPAMPSFCFFGCRFEKCAPKMRARGTCPLCPPRDAIVRTSEKASQFCPKILMPLHKIRISFAFLQAQIIFFNEFPISLNLISRMWQILTMRKRRTSGNGRMSKQHGEHENRGMVRYFPPRSLFAIF